MPEVTVIDYGIGNILNVKRGFEQCGADVVLVNQPEAVIDASHLVLPGVGAFADGMVGLRECGMIEVIVEHATSGKPILGICLGMQMLLDGSDEFGDNRGLGLIPGRNRAIPKEGKDGIAHKIPHIGWNELRSSHGQQFWEGTILSGTAEKTAVYFVHSFMAEPDDENCRLADTYYNGCRITAVLCKENIYGCQFHPEKSGPRGLKILETFLSI